MIARNKNAENRCAIYTRKSTDEGLEKEFNSLDAQRESGEAYIKSQASEGWICLPDRYDDGGFTGGNMDRPGLKKLIADIEVGKVDCVVVYKVDRLSRSLLDFAKLVEVFDRHKVAFVSVTQLINTSNSMGRLMLNVLLSFAQFEREIISERTRDKIAATRRKGKWSGGTPLLGYDIDPNCSKLILNEREARQVREIYHIYSERNSLVETMKELDCRGWHNKKWTTRSGLTRGGQPFTKATLYRLLTNVTYVGQVRYKSEVHPGEHPAIVDKELWQDVNSMLARNGNDGGAQVRNRFGAILKGILTCATCDCAMTPSHSTKQGQKRYRYYVCTRAQKRGWHTCATKSVPAGEIERYVVDQIRCIGLDQDLVRETIDAANQLAQKERERLSQHLREIERELGLVHKQISQIVTSANAAQLAVLHERAMKLDLERVACLQEISELQSLSVDERELREAMMRFDPIWNALPSTKQGELVRALIEHVSYDGHEGTIEITFRPTGIQTLTQQLQSVVEDAA